MAEQITNIVYDTHYPINKQDKTVEEKKEKEISKTNSQKNLTKKESLFDRIITKLFFFETTKKEKNSNTNSVTKETIKDNNVIKDKTIREQVQYILNVPDNEYSDKKLTSELRQYIQETENHYNSIVTNAKNHIAPSYREVKTNNFNIAGMLGKTYYTNSYPSYMDALWTRDILEFHSKRDMSFFIFPEDDSRIKTQLKHKATQIKAEINDAVAKGVTLDTEIQVQYQDVETIRQKLATHEERYFETGMYITIYNEEKEKLREDSKKLEQKLAGLSIRSKPASFRMDEGFSTTLPLCIDDLGITRSTITSSIAGSFPFISQDLIQKSWILYWVNLHTGWLVIFDRFASNLPNMNSVVLATSGAGKSYTVKLEIMRYLLTGVDVIVIDPENEYKWLIDKVWGTYINIATNSQQYINPFDLPPEIYDRDYQPWDLLRGQIVSLLGMMKIILGGMTASEEALIDKALQNTYQLKWMSFDETSYYDRQPPTMEDLLQILEGMAGWEELAIKINKYVGGTFGKIFNNYTNVNINDKLTIFSIRDLEEALKTPAMYNVLNFIWTQVRATKKPRLVVCDEARIMLQSDISANFLFWLIKRARKYWLWITTITQDVEDLTRSPYGKPIVSNSSMQVLLKQSTSSIKTLDEIIGLSEAEKQRLVAAGIGEGLFFVWGQHIATKVLASAEEHRFITTGLEKR